MLGNDHGRGFAKKSTGARAGVMAGLLAAALAGIFLAVTSSHGIEYPVTDTQVKQIPTVPKPGYLQSYVDPVFGNKVTRITGDPGTPIPQLGGVWGEVARHNYSKVPVWNADQSMMILDMGLSLMKNGPSPIFLDGSTYQLLFTKESPGSEVRWHPREPDLMVYVGGNEVGTWNVRTGEKTVIESFPGYVRFRLVPGEGNISLDGSMLAVYARKGDDKVAFAYDMLKKVKYPDLDLNGIGVDWVSISPLGRYLVLNRQEKEDSPLDDTTQVYDLQGNKVGSAWSEYGRPSHYDLTIDQNGDEVAVGVSKSAPDNGRVIKRRLRDGVVTVLTDGGYAVHTSTRNIRRPGWAYVSYGCDEKWLLYRDEVVAVKLDGSKRVERLAHLHTNRTDYVTEAHACPSPDGRRVIWASNWESPTGRPVGAYVVEVCPPTQ